MHLHRWQRTTLIVIAVILVLAGAVAWYFRSTDTRATPVPPDTATILSGVKNDPLPAQPKAIVVIVEENKSFTDIVGNPKAPFLNRLVPQAALFTQSYGVAHPSQPNYFALFAGIADENGDACAVKGVPPAAPNLGAALLASGKTFVGYAEDLPAPGFRGCKAGQYVRKHAPWTHFTNVPASSIQPFSALRDYGKLPAVSFVIPNVLHDMHSASIEDGDAWLEKHVAPLIAWAQRNDGLVIVTWDESSATFNNRIPTLFLGPMVKPGSYGEVITHQRVLRTLADLTHVKPSGEAANVAPITDIWKLPAHPG